MFYSALYFPKHLEEQCAVHYVFTTWQLHGFFKWNYYDHPYLSRGIYDDTMIYYVEKHWKN